MKTITETSNFGRFATKISCEIGDEVNAETEVLCRDGLTNSLFRHGGSAGEKGLVAAGFATKDDKRSEIVYSDEAARALEAAINGAFDKARTAAKEKGETPLPVMVVEVTGEHVYGETQSAMVRATNMVDAFLGTDLEVGYRAILGDGTREELITKAHSMGLGVTASKAKK